MARGGAEQYSNIQIASAVFNRCVDPTTTNESTSHVNCCTIYWYIEWPEVAQYLRGREDALLSLRAS